MKRQVTIWGLLGILAFASSARAAEKTGPFACRMKVMATYACTLDPHDPACGPNDRPEYFEAKANVRFKWLAGQTCADSVIEFDKSGDPTPFVWIQSCLGPWGRLVVPAGDFQISLGRDYSGPKPWKLELSIASKLPGSWVRLSSDRGVFSGTPNGSFSIEDQFGMSLEDGRSILMKAHVECDVR